MDNWLTDEPAAIGHVVDGLANRLVVSNRPRPSCLPQSTALDQVSYWVPLELLNIPQPAYSPHGPLASSPNAQPSIHRVPASS
jgi:hypothetical protein